MFKLSCNSSTDDPPNKEPTLAVGFLFGTFRLGLGHSTFGNVGVRIALSIAYA